MDMNKIRLASDAVWYCRKDAEEERFYEIFFQLCRKYSVRWASATPKEKIFIEEVTRVTYERDRAQRLGCRCRWCAPRSRPESCLTHTVTHTGK